MQITLKYLAEQLNLSTATVSKALKDYPDISPKTKDKVKKLATLLNYQPNISAVNLRNNESKIIGLIVPELVHYFFSNIIKGVVKTAKTHGYLVIILPSEESYEDEVKLVKELVDKHVDGILLSLSDNTVNFDHIKAVISKGTPIVLYDKISKSIDVSKVVINDILAAKQATEYLIKTGCKNIAHIRGPLKPQTTIDRFKGYRQAIEENGLTYKSELVFNAEHLSYEDGYNLTKQIIEEFPEVDGIFCFTDIIAMGALKCLNTYKIKIPEQISIIGFSNWFVTQVSSPTLTTVNQPGYEIGSKACKLLIEEIQNKRHKKTFKSQILEVASELVIRESTR